MTMTKRVAFIGIAIAVLAIGLVGLVLWQAGVFSRHTWTGPAVDLPQGKPHGPEPENPDAQAAFERRQLPVPESGKQALEPGGQIAQPPQPEGPPSFQGGPGPASDLQGPSQPEPGSEKPIPVPQVEKGERRYPGQAPLAQPESATRSAEDAGKILTRKPGDTETGGKKAHPGPTDGNAVRPVVIKFGFDPARNREMSVALVHFGDTISVKVRRAGQLDCKLYLTFGFSGTFETGAYREWSAGPRRAFAAPVRDGCRIALTGADDFGAGMPGSLNSKEGAVLKLGADCSAYRRPRIYRDDCYEIEMRIYPGNRWKIRPKSLV